MQPPQNQDATYLPSNSVDRSLLWLVLAISGMAFFMLALVSREPASAQRDQSYLSRRTDEMLDEDRRPPSPDETADLGIR